MTDTVKRSRRVVADIKKSVDNAEDTISKHELETIKAEAAKVGDLQKSLEEASAKTAELDILKAALGDLKVEDLVKAASELADLKKSQEIKVLNDTIDVVKGYNLFDEDKVEDIAKFFVNHAGEEVTLILTSLEKARKAIQEFGEAEHGSDHTGETVDVEKSDAATKELGESVLDIIKSRKKS